MFEHINFEQSTNLCRIIAFVLTFGVFLTAVVWALLMKPSRRDQLASLPLDDDERPSSESSQTL